MPKPKFKFGAKCKDCGKPVFGKNHKCTGAKEKK